ncbi:MAG: hypothetical protein WC972_14070 [Trueperaceae bacterium]
MKLSGFAAALVAAALFGAVALNTASAAFPPAPGWATDMQACPFLQVCERPTPAPSAGDLVARDGEDAGEVQTIECSITDGCEVDVTFVTDEGEVAKRMIITLVDPEPEAEPTADTE